VGPSGGPAQGLEGWRANATCATPQMPLTAAQVEEKFFECAADTVERPAATQIFAFMNRAGAAIRATVAPDETRVAGGAYFGAMQA
jgi:hypothetical protein